MGKNEHCEEHSELEKTANDAMKLSRRAWDDVNTAKNDLTWIKHNDNRVFKIALGMLCASFVLVVTVIFSAGVLYQSFQDHRGIEHKHVDGKLKEIEGLQDLLERHILFEDTKANNELSKRRKKWDEDNEPIYAVRDGEGC